MKTKLVTVNLVTLLALTVVVLLGQGAGPLNPPAAPADGVYRTLEEVYNRALAAETNAVAAAAKADPRIPIHQADLPFTIFQSGSYYFAEDLHVASGNGITISTDDVTLDLLGHTLSSDPGVTSIGIFIFNGASRVTISNGSVKGTTTVTESGGSWNVTAGGFTRGISTETAGAFDDLPRQCRFENLQFSGCRTIGLLAGTGATVVRCSAEENGAGGIGCTQGTIVECTARLNGDDAFNMKITGSTVVPVGGITCWEGSVTNSTARRNGNAGFEAGKCTVAGCVATNNGGAGILATSGTVYNCRAASNGASGISALDGGSVTNCTADSNGGLGIGAETANNCTARDNANVGISAKTVTGCTSLRNLIGFQASGVLALSFAASNSLNDVDAAAATRTGNNPAP